MVSFESAKHQRQLSKAMATVVRCAPNKTRSNICSNEQGWLEQISACGASTEGSTGSFAHQFYANTFLPVPMHCTACALTASPPAHVFG